MNFVANIVVTAFSVLKAKSQKTSRSALSDVISNSRQCILEGASWAATVSDPQNSAVLSCLASGLGCANGSSGPIRLRQAGGKMFCTAGYNAFDKRQGFTTNGEVCTKFSEHGNDSCPYRIEFSWYADCPKLAGITPASCLEPAQTVVMAILFSPSRNSKILRLNLGDGIDRSNFTSASTVAVTRLSSNRLTALSRYGTDQAKGSEALRNQVSTSSSLRLPLVITEQLPVGTPAGACRAGAYVRRNLNFVQSDPGVLLSGPIDAVNGFFTLRKGFTYECAFSAPSFQTGLYFAFLKNADSGQLMIRGSTRFSSGALGFAQTRSLGSGSFTLTQDTKFELDQYCAEAPDSLKAVHLGVSFGVGDEVYSFVRCKATQAI